MPLERRGAWITGGGRGIGAEVARCLAEAGARVIVSARTETEIEGVAAQLRQSGFDAWALPCDVTDPEQIEMLMGRAHELLGPVQILVNNAGVAASAPFLKITLEDWNRMLTVNATGAFLCSQAVLPDMLESGWGRVVNVASIAGKMGAPYIAAYCASKHALLGLTRAMASELASAGITVNAVCPGYVDTPMTQASIAHITRKTGRSDQEARDHLISTNPQRRLIEAREVADLVANLCEPGARGINGQAIVLDGGAVQS